MRLADVEVVCSFAVAREFNVTKDWLIHFAVVRTAELKVGAPEFMAFFFLFFLFSFYWFAKNFFVPYRSILLLFFGGGGISGNG